jgi:hypothetical protein
VTPLLIILLLVLCVAAAPSAAAYEDEAIGPARGKPLCERGIAEAPKLLSDAANRGIGVEEAVEPMARRRAKPPPMPADAGRDVSEPLRGAMLGLSDGSLTTAWVRGATADAGRGGNIEVAAREPRWCPSSDGWYIWMESAKSNRRQHTVWGHYCMKCASLLFPSRLCKKKKKQGTGF